MTAPALVAELHARIGALDIDASLDTGDGTLLLVGPNGAGKSTLLSLLLGALPCARGHIEVGGAVLFDDRTRVNVPIEARRFAYLPQDYGLFPHLSVRENLAFAVRCRAGRRDPTLDARVDDALAAFGLTSLAARRPRTLSGGEQQRVALARAVATRPRALLLDEPLAALDVAARQDVRASLVETLARLALPTVVITHDPADLRALGGRVVVLERGRVTQQGSLAELRARPATRFVEQLVASC
ncbi:MAG: ATP-binding cassette domain-containing protein [Deltaproteobacteria bacterium]|nr:ATP-binding cassette domain-containing protein [Deltaproteobacteria bacterium]